MKRSEGNAMKKDIEWLKEEVEKQEIVMDKGYIYTDDLIYLIDQLDEPEVLSQDLPVVPKYVADWLVSHREKFDLYPALRTLENNTLVWGAIYKWYRTNTHKFVNAYSTGEYEVEEEQKYYAMAKGHELMDSSLKYWTYHKHNKSLYLGYCYSSMGDRASRFTKSEWDELGINDSNADFVEVEE